MTFFLSRIRKISVLGILALALLFMPTPQRVARARAASEVAVDIHVTVHNSDIGVSKEVLDAAVEHVLEEAHITSGAEKAHAVPVQLKIDVCRADNGQVKIDGQL